MRIALIIAWTLLVTTLATKTNADPLYSATNLGTDRNFDGTGYTLQTDPSGYVHSVTNSAGTVTYAFDKSPVTQIDERQNGGSHLNSYTEYTLQNASYKVGFYYDYLGDLPGPTFWPTFVPPPRNEWSSSGVRFVSEWSSSDPSGVLSDMNIHGQVVGEGSLDYYDPLKSFAAFSDVGSKPHGAFSAASDNLNDYILPIPGVTLTLGETIDDSGRIIARGSNGDAYLLTPTALGPPHTVPEPTTLILAGMLGSWIGVRSLHRRLRSKNGA